MTRAQAPARAAIQASFARRGRGPVNLPTAKSATGTQLMPATKPKCGTWAAMAPVKANVSPPRKLATGARRDARRKAKVPNPATHHVTIKLTVHAALAGNTANSHVNG